MPFGRSIADLLITCQIAQQVCELAHTARNFWKPALPRSSLLQLCGRVYGDAATQLSSA
jgi:hypothetical protein